ncbi:MAG: type II secretion system inner membrane protein GspF [Deltaproteobacteria bacterium]|nr:type II secretion system inner membrane protein GspF [Deltaproteobacteria bacterium]
MAVYEYKAINRKGREKSGIIEAESRISAGQSLKRMNLYPVAILETTRESLQDKPSTEISVRSLLERVTRRDISLFTTQFAALVEAGLPVVEAFDITIRQTEKKSVRRVLSVIKEEVNQGVSMADSFQMFPRHFTPLYINMVRAGEESGSLEVVLKRLSDFLESQIEMRSKISSTLAYPILMSLVGVAVVFFLVAFVIPTVTTIFEDMNQALPLPTVILLGISGFLKSAWPYLAILLVILYIGLRSFKRTDRGRAFVDRMKLRIPVFAPQYKRIIMTRFTRTLGTLLANGVPIVVSFNIVKNVVGNTQVAAGIEKARDDIKEGREIASPLAESGFFPPVVVNMIAVGEKSGQLEEMLNRVSRIMEAELDSSLKRFMSLLEPIMILVMGAVVLFIVVSILLPIFEMNQLIR